jgi:negative regulator of flagellin synthesis FlgM
MSNKINGIDNGRTAPVGAGRAVERVKDVGSEQKDFETGSTSDVEITGTARQLADLEQTLAKQPAVDEKRVAEARSAIEQGSYKVSPERIADELVQLERALGRLER